MPQAFLQRAFRITHTADVPAARPRLGPNVTRRLPMRTVSARRIELGVVEGSPGVALRLLQADGAAQCEVHPDLALAIGQAELEFGIPPSAWQAVEGRAQAS
jgi:hypothetical protein